MTNTATGASKEHRRRTTIIPVTTMEEIPVLSDKERAEFIDAMNEAQRRLQDGDGIEYDSKTFKDRLVSIYRGGKR
jgi:hypothetical protein